jgi:hypothetical protein
MTLTRIFRSSIFLISLLAVLSLASCNLPVGNLFGSASPTPLPSPTQIVLPPVLTGSINGQIWHDVCAVPGEGQPAPDQPPEGCIATEGGGYRANGVQEGDEPGIEGLEISLGVGACPSTGLANTTTNVDGAFVFPDLEAGIYCLIVDPSHPKNSQILIPGEWTTGPADASGLISMTINLGEGQAYTAESFGWDFQFLPPYELPPTETASASETPEPSETPELTETATKTEEVTSTPTPEGTPIAQDPNLPTGNPAWRDSFDNSENWGMSNNKWEYEDHGLFEVKDGKMSMTAYNPDYFEFWMFTWPSLSDAYLEATFIVENCSGRDRYGLRFRSPDPAEDGTGYSFGITCDGRYSLRTWDGEEFEDVIPWTSSGLIQTGSGKTQRLGLWAKGNRFILFIDREKLAEVQDSTYDAGKFGLFIGSVETDDLKVKVDEIAYWNLQ